MGHALGASGSGAMGVAMMDPRDPWGVQRMLRVLVTVGVLILIWAMVVFAWGVVNTWPVKELPQ